MRFWSACLALVLCTGPGVADHSSPSATEKHSRVRVEGTALIYDTTHGAPDRQEMLAKDIAVFRALLAANPDVSEVRMTSNGGSVGVARDLAQIILARGLDTRVDTVCESSCTIMFLAGRSRSLAPGADIGFHRFTLNAASIAEMFERDRGNLGWSTPYDMGAWLFEDTQREVYDHLLYMINRGVDPAFAIRTLQSGSGEMWYPSALVLSAAGVLRP